MEYAKVSASAFQQLQMNAGVVVDDFDPSSGVIGNIIGATTGGLQFASNPTYEDFGEDIDNVPANTWQLKRIMYYDPSISGTFLTITPSVAKALTGAGTVDGAHIVPSQSLTADDFDDIWIVGDYSDANVNGVGTTAGFVAVHLMHAMKTSGFKWQSTKNGKGQMSFEFHGHYDLTNIDEVPFEIYVKAGTPALAALTVASEAGSSTGKSKITVSGYTLGQNESYVYKTASGSAPAVAYGDNVSTWTALTSGNDITPTSGHTKITVAVKNSSSLAVGAGSATLTIA